ncbi:MAG: hypothetical protein HN726_05750 [Candidatus Magasanikbacteria bacterium]|nr:hypothetical protein [Candidatus Magasanikbacteria bacterium]
MSSLYAVLIKCAAFNDGVDGASKYVEIEILFHLTNPLFVIVAGVIASGVFLVSGERGGSL